MHLIILSIVKNRKLFEIVLNEMMIKKNSEPLGWRFEELDSGGSWRFICCRHFKRRNFKVRQQKQFTGTECWLFVVQLPDPWRMIFDDIAIMIRWSSHFIHLYPWCLLCFGDHVSHLSARAQIIWKCKINNLGFIFREILSETSPPNHQTLVLPREAIFWPTTHWWLPAILLASGKKLCGCCAKLPAISCRETRDLANHRVICSRETIDSHSTLLKWELFHIVI